MAMTNIRPKPDTLFRSLIWHFNRFLERHLPRGLYPRSLIIVIAPMILLQSLMTFFIMEQHWSAVTKLLSRAAVRDMAYVISVYENSDKSPQTIRKIEEMANRHLKIGLTVQQKTTLPPPARKPYFSLVEKKMSKYIGNRIRKPFWLDTTSHENRIDARIQVSKGLVFRFIIPSNRVAASQTLALLVAMITSSFVLLVVAIAFLRKQIRPILDLATAARSFGMGREVKEFQPSGALEVQSAAEAFLSMKDRIARHVEQRTAMLAGVSHDLRTILTRFRLEMAFLGDSETLTAMKDDVNEMQRMLEGYMSFVRGDGGETSQPTQIMDILKSVQSEQTKAGHVVRLKHRQPIEVAVKPDAFKRLVSNIVTNATRFATKVDINAELTGNCLVVTIEDNGPGIPPERREEVFRPFVQLDEARNRDEINTGLGLAIAQDIVHSHGGRITLDDSPAGGLKVTIEIPV